MVVAVGVAVDVVVVVVVKDAAIVVVVPVVIAPIMGVAVVVGKTL